MSKKIISIRPAKGYGYEGSIEMDLITSPPSTSLEVTKEGHRIVHYGKKFGWHDVHILLINLRDNLTDYPLCWWQFRDDICDFLDRAFKVPHLHSISKYYELEEEFYNGVEFCMNFFPDLLWWVVGQMEKIGRRKKCKH